MSSLMSLSSFSQPRLSATDQLTILPMAIWVASNPGASRGEIIAALTSMGIVNTQAPSTVYRWLERAIELKLLDSSGITSGTKYRATPLLQRKLLLDHLNTPVEDRPRVGYNEDWLAGYKPNETQYLSAAAMAKLKARCPIGSAPLSQINDHEISKFLCDLTYASSRLEGSKMDQVNTMKLLQFNVQARASTGEPMDATDLNMALNHRDAQRMLLDSVKAFGAYEITPENVLGVHALLSHDLLQHQDVGTLRVEPVRMDNSSYIPPDNPLDIAQYFDTICEKAHEINNPYEQSFFLLVHLAYLQPFLDCNKRTTRVLCNAPLLNQGCIPINWTDTSMRPHDYTRAVIAIYELNDTSLMEEIFTHSFLTSCNNFSMMQRHKSPDPVTAIYRQELKEFIHSFIKHNEPQPLPQNLQEQDASAFRAYVMGELRALQSNPVIGVRYGLAPHQVSSWVATMKDDLKDENVFPDAPIEIDQEPQVERVRG